MLRCFESIVYNSPTHLVVVLDFARWLFDHVHDLVERGGGLRFCSCLCIPIVRNSIHVQFNFAYGSHYRIADESDCGDHHRVLLGHNMCGHPRFLI